MTVGEIKNIIANLPDNTEVEINSVWNEDSQELTPTGCSGFYHERDKKVYLTPDVIEPPYEGGYENLDDDEDYEDD